MNTGKRVAEKYDKLIVLLLGFATVCGMTMNMKVSSSTDPGIIKYLKSMGGFSMTRAVLVAGAAMLYHSAFSYLKGCRFSFRDKVWIGIPAFLFANFMTWGTAFEMSDSYDMLIVNKVQMLKTFTMTAAYLMLFTVLIACLFKGLDRFQVRSRAGAAKNAYVRLFYRYPFLTPFVTMLLCYLPIAIVCYPGVVMGDTRMMISEGYNLPSSAARGAKLLDPNVLLTGHHTVFYPVFMHVCLVISKVLFDSFNPGIYMVAMSQLMTTLVIVSYTLRYMIRQDIRFGVVVSVMLYYILCPRIQSYQLLITKDVLCGCAMLMFAVSVFRLYKERDHITWKRMFLVFLSATGVGFLRNDGKFIILLSLIVMLLFFGRKCVRQLLAILLLFVVVVFGFFTVVMPALHITPVTSRVIYSVPFQQTARYIRDYGDEVTEEEKEAISRVLDYDRIADRYNPDKSDPVKALYNPDVTTEDMVAYFKAWWQMFLKHPGVYVAATMNNYYYYFYPGQEAAYTYSFQYSTRLMNERINSDKYLKELGMDLHYPEEMTYLRLLYEALRESIFSLPGLNIFKWSASYVWALILLGCYVLKKKRWNLLAYTSPMFFVLLMCIVSPCNGTYFRYLYSVTYCLPVVAVFVLEEIKNRKSDKSSA